MAAEVSLLHDGKMNVDLDSHYLSRMLGIVYQLFDISDDGIHM